MNLATNELRKTDLTDEERKEALIVRNTAISDLDNVKSEIEANKEAINLADKFLEEDWHTEDERKKVKEIKNQARENIKRYGGGNRRNLLGTGVTDPEIEEELKEGNQLIEEFKEILSNVPRGRKPKKKLKKEVDEKYQLIE